MGEIASSIAESKIKAGDVNGILHVCSLIHQRYSDFSAMLLENIKRIMPQKKVDVVSFAKVMSYQLG